MSFGRALRNHISNVFTNLEQPGMPAWVKWSRFVRNRWHAMVLMKGCCGHPGDPGC